MEQPTSTAIIAPPKRPTNVKKRNSTVDSANGSQPNTPSPVKRRKKGEGQVFNNCDAYCWLCHRDGKVSKCAACPRVFHIRCLGVETLQTTDWVCNECTVVLNSENIETRTKSMKMISLDQLCNLLRFALNRMKHSGDEAFLKPVSLEEFPTYSDFVYHPMDLTTLEKNVRNKMYGSTESFLSDAKWILHNCIIFNGYQHRLTSSAKSIIKVCRFEMNEIEVCPFCYLNSYTSKDNWFCDPCEEPHVLVWAKLKGFPYWPAKAMRVIDSNVDVRFFGAHDRAWIPVNQCFLLCRDIPTASKNKKKGSFEQSMEELELHINRLQRRFGPFQYAPFRTPLNPDDLESQLNTFLPEYTKKSNLDGKNRCEDSAPVETSTESPDKNCSNDISPPNCETWNEDSKENARENEEKNEESSPNSPESRDNKESDDFGHQHSSPAKKSSAFVHKLDKTIESCKAQLGVEEIANLDENGDKQNDKTDDIKSEIKEEENEKRIKDQDKADLDMECSDDGDLIIDLNEKESENKNKNLLQSTSSKGKTNNDKKNRKSRSRSEPSTTKTSVVNPSANSSTSYPHTLMPTLQSRTLVTGRGAHQVAPPYSPGPGCDMNKYSRKMMDFMRGTVEEMFRDMASSGNLEAKVKTLQLEIEKLQWRHQQELAEIKHNADLILLEMRASLESDKVRALTELKRQCEEEKQKAIEETKKKQWCANCGKDAIFYCCWNTSYCDFSCQSAHWPQHMSICTQSQGATENEDAPKGVPTTPTGPAKLMSPTATGQMQRANQKPNQRNSIANRREENQETWSGANFKRHEEEQREKQRIQTQIHSSTVTSTTQSATNQYSNSLSGPVQYIPSNAVQVIPQTSSLANSSALQVQYNMTPNSPQSLSSPVTSSFTSLNVSSAFPLQQNLCHQQPTNQRPSVQAHQRSLQMNNSMYPIVVQPGNQFQGGPQTSPTETYPRGPYIPGKPYHLS